MKLLRILTLALGLAALLPVQNAYAGGTKSASVFPRNLSVEEIAKMVYEAAKNDPANAAVIFLDALTSRDSWTAAELNFVIDALMIAVPDMPTNEIISLLDDGGVPANVIDGVRADAAVVPSTAPVPAVPPSVPVYPVIPSPDDVSGVN